MPRPSLPLGTAGRVTTLPTETGWRSRARVRDFDGVTRQVQAHGATKAQAERRLAAAIRDRSYAGGGAGLSRDSQVAELAERWFVDLESQDKALRTMEQYRYALDRSVVPGLGALRIRELTVGTCHRFLRAVEAKHGSAVARTTRSVLSGVMGFATRLDLIDHNPVRDTGSISTRTKKAPRALTVPQVWQLRMTLRSDALAVKRDIPDFCDFMLASGLRASEAFGIRWCDVDLDDGTVAITGNVVRVKGLGLIRQEDESSKLTRRVLTLPVWAVALLRHRFEASRPSWP